MLASKLVFKAQKKYFSNKYPNISYTFKIIMVLDVHHKHHIYQILKLDPCYLFNYSFN